MEIANGPGVASLKFAIQIRIVILSEAKDLLTYQRTKQQVLRFAQDDNIKYGVSAVALVLDCFQIDPYLLGLLIKMRTLQSQGPRRVRDLVVIAFQLRQNGLFLEGAHAVG